MREQPLGPYRLESLLGRGGMGEVFRAYDTRLERRVAIKHIRPEIIDDPRARARFRREAKTIARLDHPAIIKIFDLLEDEDGDWMVMELLEGASLAQELRRSRPLLGRILEWGREIAEGLAEAHEKNVVHRDLKPANVFITTAGRVKILDFGLAKQIHRDPGISESEPSASIPGEILGTGSAMSPEQARGQTVDHRTDLFALGTLLYKMTTGISPFQADSLAETLSRVLHHQPTPICQIDPRLPAELSDLVEHLHGKAPELRPASARTVAARLAAVAPGREAVVDDDPTTIAASSVDVQPDTPADESWPSPSAPPRTSRWRGVMAVFLAMVLLALSLAAWLTRESRVETVNSSQPVAAADLPDNATPLELYERGMELLRRHDRAENIDRAITVFHRSLGDHGESAAAYAGLARAYWWRHRDDNRDPIFLDKARGAALRGVALDEHLADARVSRGLVHLSSGQFEDAIADLEMALILEPTNADAHFGLAEVHEREGRLDEAEAAYLRALEYAPDDHRLHDDLGALYFKTGRYLEAEASFRGSVELVPDAIHGHRNLSAAYYMQGRYAEAAEEVQEALKISPRPDLYSNLGTLLFAQGLYPASATAFEKSLELGAANNYLVWANLADAYRWTRLREKEALDSYLRAIQLIRDEIERQPANGTLRSQLALYLAKRGDVTEAQEKLTWLETSGSKTASLLYRMAVTYEICGRRGRALETLNQAMEAGFSRSNIEHDPELTKLRADPDYHRLVATHSISCRNPRSSPDPRKTSASRWRHGYWKSSRLS